ncbi:MAG: DUF1329 domain-containing protein [Deltaproteobacteria bacterium]|nr:DUF1329 domain-containing protein [Deltaproteobacteria bacterium]
MQKQLCGMLLCFVCLTWQPVQAEIPAAVIQQMFHPYASGKPSVEGLAPGTTISKDSWEGAKDCLPPEILDRVKAGEFAFAVQETTDLPVSEAYIEATRQHAERVKIGADGELEGYVTGLPFPVLDLADPQAGLKAAWDLRHRDFGDSMQVWNTFRIVPESGSAEREMENYYVIAYGMHRPQTDGGNPNKWEKEGILYKEFYHLLSPFDLKNTMSLKHRYVRDQANDDNWTYTPASRKIRKVIIKHDEALYDSGLTNEDGFGFWGYVRSYAWKFLGFRRLLAPVGIKAASTTFGGRGGWYPVDPWELREMLVLEGTPKASDHPYSKRVLYIDQQMFAPVYTLLYDRQGKHQKTLFELYGNPKYNPGNEQVRVPLWVGETMIDHYNNFAAVTVVTKTVYNVPLPDDFFNLDKIAARGQ